MFPSENDMIQAIKYYKDTNNSDELCKMFTYLTEVIIDNCKFIKNLTSRDDLIQEGVLFGFEKLKRFDADKGRAVNFFVSTIMCHLRQICRSVKMSSE